MILAADAQRVGLDGRRLERDAQTGENIVLDRVAFARQADAAATPANPVNTLRSMKLPTVLAVTETPVLLPPSSSRPPRSATLRPSSLRPNQLSATWLFDEPR